MVFIKNDCWNLIKTYAGIYSISTDWDEIHSISMKELHKFHKLLHPYNTFNELNIYKYIHKPYNSLREKKICVLKSCVARFNSKSLWIKLHDLLRKEIMRPPVIIGSEIIYYAPGSVDSLYDRRFGIVTKINKKSILITPCKPIFVLKKMTTVVYTWQERKEMSVYDWDKTTVVKSIRIKKYEIETKDNKKYFKNIKFYSK
jgi:glutaredoxin-related protein